MSSSTPSLFRRVLPSLLPALVIVAAAVTIVVRSAEARQVATEAIELVFTFFTTPFILETSLAVCGFLAVLVYNARRLEKEKDEWVVMEVPVRPTAPEPGNQPL